MGENSSNLLNAENFIRHVGIYYLKLILLMRDTAEIIGHLLTEMLHFKWWIGAYEDLLINFKAWVAFIISTFNP